jgi:hypothetical protein
MYSLLTSEIDGNEWSVSGSYRFTQEKYLPVNSMQEAG